jgi:hypothetical protein
VYLKLRSQTGLPPKCLTKLAHVLIAFLEGATMTKRKVLWHHQQDDAEAVDIVDNLSFNPFQVKTTSELGSRFFFSGLIKDS